MKRKTLSSFIPPLYSDARTGQIVTTEAREPTGHNKEQASMTMPTDTMTLPELRGLSQSLGWGAPAHDFTDMHDWGDMLLAAGFADPVMDMERITLTFETPERLLQELRGLGRNLHPQRFEGLRTRRWHAQLQQELAKTPLSLTFEVVYGHAVKPAPRLDIRAETVLSLAQMRETLNQRKNYPVKP